MAIIVLSHKAKIGDIMQFKPKTSVGLVKAQVYKRYQQLDKASSLSVVYSTTVNNKTQYWTFDSSLANDTYEITVGSSTLTCSNAFILIDYDNMATAHFGTTVDVTTTLVTLQYKNTYFQYNTTNKKWLVVTTSQNTLSAKFGSIAQYQLNKYYYSKSFDFMLRGDVAGATTQYIKGNTMSLTTLSIRYFDDTINLQPDDLVVVEGRLYSVENPQANVKYSPKRFATYYATLNSIL